MALSQGKIPFWRYFQDGLLETIVISQIFGLIAAVVLMIYSEMAPGAEAVPISFIFTNCLGLGIKIVGAITYSLFYSPGHGKRLIHVILWFSSIVIGTVIGSEGAIRLSSYLFWAQFPKLFTQDHYKLLGANLIMASAFSFIVISLVLVRKRLKRKILENERILYLQTQTELVALQSKINPHFLFNTLNTMLNLVYKAPDKVETMILNLSDIYRKILQFPEEKVISLKEEIRLLNGYLEIEKLRMGDRLKYKVNVETELEQCQIPPLLIEPLVENAIIHGISPKPKGGSVEVSVKKSGKMMVVSVTDDGIGMNEAGQKAGFGLSSVKDRIQLIYKEKANFEIIDLPEGGVKVLMEIPCED
jgi:sensor histidine kinase YesM